MSQKIRRPPEFGGIIGPDWYHWHGDRIRVKSLDKTSRVLILGSNTASLIIRKRTKKEEQWFVEWKIIQARTEGLKINGRMIFSTSQIMAAFGLVEYSDDLIDWWLINRYGGDCAVQRCFIRYEFYLNIPGPGTGADGDPNISILIDEDIQNAVQNLLA